MSSIAPSNFRAATLKERLSMPRRRRGRILRVRIVLYSGPIEGLCERNLRKSKQGKLYAEVEDVHLPISEQRR